MLKNFLILTAFLVFFSLSIVKGDEANPHPFIAGERACIECHRYKKIDVTFENTENACSYMCVSCHKDMDRHHAINVRVTEDVSDNLVLTSRKKLACVTCHRLKTKRYDSESWKAESLYENVFHSKKMYKTYYLVTRNNEGQLCKMCH